MKRAVSVAGWALAGLLAISGCKGDAGSASIAPHKPVTFDTAPIAIDDFEKSAKTQRRCLYMPFGEAAARLGSLAPLAVGKAKTLVRQSTDLDAAASFQLEGLVQEVLMRQPDLMERFPAALRLIREGIDHPE